MDMLVQISIFYPTIFSDNNVLEIIIKYWKLSIGMYQSSANDEFDESNGI